MKRLLLLAALLFLIQTQPVLAEITSSYTVDEKPRVLFGDSAELIATTTYYGLENYSYNYVGDYLHITFTYTHNQCCFASNPPKLYITALDPRSTTTPNAKDQPDVFALRSGTHPTDWYAYDVQFDATGFNVSVMQGGATSTNNSHYVVSGLAQSDHIALVNTYPKQDPISAYSMAFTPLPIYNAPVPIVATTTPVIIVPGIMNTRLLENGNLIWPDTIQIASSITDVFLDVLKMDINGDSLNSSILSGDITKILNNADYFDGLFTQFSLNNYQENTDIFPSPYDWRLDINSSSLELKEKIDEVKTQRGVTEVNLVAHSMGGLLVKKYLKDYGGDSINKFVDISTPHTGAPSAYKILMYGDDLGVKKFFGLININAEKIKEISQNMPAVYQLLPSQRYFDSAEYYVLDATNGNNRLDFGETKSYLATQGRNSALVERADIFHQEIDNLNPADYGVEAYNIVGCGTPTIGQFYILQGGEHPIYNIRLVNGDGTVPLQSAEAMLATSTYYVRSAQHALMPSTAGVKELVTGILTATSTSFDISPYSNLSASASGCTIPDGRMVSMHSPVTLNIYDQSGNHAGPDSNGDIENNISGVTYEVIGDNKFAYLPNGTSYLVKGSATDSGSFDLRIQEVVNGEVVNTSLWNDVALSSTTQTQLSINSNTPTQIDLDHNNDGVYEQPLNSTLVVAGILESTGSDSTGTTAVATSVSSKARDSSFPVFATTSTLVLAKATGTKETLAGKPIATSAPKIVAKAPAPEKPFKLATTTPTRTQNKTAVAYQSLNLKVKIGFLKALLWIKTKF